MKEKYRRQLTILPAKKQWTSKSAMSFLNDFKHLKVFVYSNNVVCMKDEWTIQRVFLKGDYFS